MTWIQQINSLPYGTYNLWGREADVSEIKHLTNKIILVILDLTKFSCVTHRPSQI